jgi:NAD(P)H-dependent FMN reductase
MNILVICGSLRKKSYTRTLTNIVFDYCREKFAGHQVDYLDLGSHALEQFRGFDENYGQETKAAIALVANADVFLIGTPVYNGLLSSGIKNLFEHINYKALDSKVAGFIIQSSGPISSLQVQGQLTALMTYFRVFSNPRAVFTYRDQHFDKAGNLIDETVKERLKRLAEETVGLAIKLKE